MKKKVLKYTLLLIFIAIIIIAICNTYDWIVSGEQYIKISTPSKAYTNSDLYISIIAQEKGVDLETKTKLKLLNSNGKKVKGAKISYNENNGIISIPEVEPGTYFIEAKVSSEAGRDKVKKEIYISNDNVENVTITFDKGIYKPGDTVNFRVLLTDKENDEPVIKDVNISIYDGNDNKVYNENVKTSDYGIMSGSFTLANEVNSGLYKLVVKTDTKETTKQFKVNPYVTPKYEVKVNYDKDKYLVGDTAKIDINAKYFFGEPVSNAKFDIYINDEKYESLTADENGKSTIEYKIKDAKTYKLRIEAVDSSNYFVEENDSFIAGTDIFEIQLLSEYGTLAAGKKNDIYVFTKNADGTPLKTYITISSDKYTKQVATDENGIGKFSIDIEQVENSDNYKKSSKNTKKFDIIAEDMDGNKVQKDISLDIEQKNLLMSTDKVKYEQGEDINIKVSSLKEDMKKIYFFKNDKLIKMITTDSDETVANLENIYGLIDIYVTDSTSNYSNSNIYRNSNNYNKNSYKKTIFIKPTKELNININTDKQEYRPGENISISFNTVNEEEMGVDAALLVSMLDNSILNLADNDLSIDNIKLALSNIKFSDELDAATLYSCIINDSQEQTLMALLLKQSNKDIKVSETGMYNYEQEEKSEMISVISIIVIAISSISFLCFKFPKFRSFMKDIINFIIFDFILVTLSFGIMAGVFRRFDYSWWTFIITTVIGLATYITVISKLKWNIFRTSISIIISCLLIILLTILVNELEVPIAIIIGIFAVVLLAFAIIAKISEVKKLKINKYIKIISKELIYMIKYIGAVTIAILLGNIIGKIIEDIIEIYDIYDIAIPIAIIGIYIFNYLFNKKEKKQEEVSDKKSAGYYIVMFFAIIGILAVGNIIYDAATEEISGVNYPPGSVNFENSAGSGKPSDIINNFRPTYEADSSTSSRPNTWGNIFAKDDDSVVSVKPQDSNNSAEVETEKATDDNIRKVFLESMCFIPELVTTNGNGKIDLTLSDNITTWTIQTIGNTKDGRIGYGILDNVKVFKEFFVDFELPKNSVETDKVSIPVTVYNYTDSPISTILKIKEEEWFSIDNQNNISLNVEAQSSKMTYITITILKAGENKLRIEATGNSLTDIVEKEFTVTPKGYKVEKVVSTGNLDEDISEDVLVLDDIIENTANVKVKIYGSTISQTVEGMENIFRMPTGCFEQISSSLYPNILALKYLEDNGIVNEEIKSKALNYISTGYQKLLTYEVKGESGGYSLYGDSPAETVLTAYGLMEITDLSEVYNVDDSVIEKMTDFLYKKQNSNGTFIITGSHMGGASSKEELSLNAYITWALSESNPNDNRLDKSVEYLKNKLKDIDDNYTLALVANVLANVGDKEVDNIVKRLVNNIKLDSNNAYITSNIVDYYGTRSNGQTIQTVALTSMALSKVSYKQDTNRLLINYLIGKKDPRGTWYSTQATILALRALNEINLRSKLENQIITVKMNSEEQKIEIKDNPLELYELTFKNINKENKLNIDIEKGNAYYEIIEEYYVPYDKIDSSKNNIEISIENNNDLKVNEILKAKVKLINRSENNIFNGMVKMAIPQGFTVIEDSLRLLENKKIIEKYEISYTEVNIYLRDFDINQIVDLDVEFRASYPVEITGLSVRAYDYYNPNVEGRTKPIEIKVKE